MRRLPPSGSRRARATRLRSRDPSSWMHGAGARRASCVSFMQLTMPPTRPGGLSQEEYVNIAAFILQSNGAPAGNQLLTAATDVTINSVATGQAPATTAHKRRARERSGRTGRSRTRRRRTGSGRRRTRSRRRASGRHHRRRRSEELRAGHRCDASQVPSPATGS